MASAQEVHCYEYVERPYERVRTLLRGHPLRFFQRATTAAAKRSQSLFSTLRLGGDGVALGVEVDVHIEHVHDEPAVAGLPPVLCLDITWRAVRAPGLFPFMRARISACPLSPSETEISIDGCYEPPLGLLGAAFEVALGRNIAKAVAHTFLDDVGAEIAREIEP
jgi:hypothetical protein